MVTIHEKTAQKFDTLGLGALLPSSCVVTEEINGAYELKLSHPYDEHGKWKRIERGRIITASTPRGMQPFRIYNMKPNMGSIEVNARHIFYDLLDNQCSEISYNGTASGALTALQGAFSFAMPFSFTTDVSVAGMLETGRMNPVQVLLSDDDETTSFVKGFGGELLRDGFNVSLLAAMGQDRDVVIRYGKNLAGLEVTEDESDVKTRILCYGSNGSAMVESPYINAYVYPKIHTLEDDGKTISELKAEAQAMLDGGADLPLVNIKVDFIPLSKTKEYADYAPLEDVLLGDIVTVIHQKMGFAKKARVISYEWDCLLNRYNEVELGDFMPTLASSVTSGVRSGSLASVAVVNASAVSAMLQNHLRDKNNPHEVTADQTGGSSGGTSLTILNAEGAEMEKREKLQFTMSDISDDGEKIIVQGIKGDTGKTPEFSIGTVKTLDAGSNATASITGTKENPILNLSIPSGENGEGAGSGILFGENEPADNAGNDGDFYLQLGKEKDYKRLESIISNGTQYIDTKFKPNNNTRVVIDVEGYSSTSSCTVFGARHSYGSNQFLVTSRSNYYSFEYGATENHLTNVNNTGRIVFDLNKNVGNMTGGYSVTAASTPFACSYPIFIFALNNGGNVAAQASIKLYSCKIYDNETLVRDYIPVLDPNGVACLYDKVEGNYCYNAGTGTFLYSEAVELPDGYSRVECLQVNGTQYVDTEFKPNQNTKMEVVYQCDNTSENTVAGCDSGWTKTGFAVGMNYAEYGNSVKSGFAMSGANKTTMLFDNGKLYKDGTLVWTATASTFQTEHNLTLFALNRSGTKQEFFSGIFWSCKIYDNGTLVRNYVSCKNASGAAGLYDTVNAKFCPNEGTGYFGTGAEIPATEKELTAGSLWLKQNGTWIRVLKGAA